MASLFEMLRRTPKVQQLDPDTGEPVGEAEDLGTEKPWSQDIDESGQPTGPKRILPVLSTTDRLARNARRNWASLVGGNPNPPVPEPSEGMATQQSLDPRTGDPIGEIQPLAVKRRAIPPGDGAGDRAYIAQQQALRDKVIPMGPVESEPATVNARRPGDTQGDRDFIAAQQALNARHVEPGVVEGPLSVALGSPTIQAHEGPEYRPSELRHSLAVGRVGNRLQPLPQFSALAPTAPQDGEDPQAVAARIAASGAKGGVAGASPAGMAARAMTGAAMGAGGGPAGIRPDVADYVSRRRAEDDEMRKAQLLGLGIKAFGGLQRAGGNFARDYTAARTNGRLRLGGSTPEQEARLAASAEAPVQNLLGERARRTASESADPDSEVSRKLRETFKAQMPGLAAKLPGFERFSANDIRGGQDKWMEAARRIQDDAHKTKAEELAARRLDVQDANTDLSRVQANENAAANRANARAIAGLAQGNRADALADKIEARKEGAKAKQDQADEKLLAQMGAKIPAEAAGFQEQYNEAKGVIDEAQRKGEGLPGVGLIAGNMPTRFLSDEGSRLRSATGQMLASYRKLITGAGMSNTERNELNSITGLLETNSDRDIREGVERLKRLQDATLQRVYAAYPQRLVGEYTQRNPALAVGAGSTTTAEAPPVTVTVKATGKSKTVTAQQAAKYANDPRFTVSP